jgi:hypothetical protein
MEKVLIPGFFTLRQSITLETVPKGQKSNQEYFVHTTLPSLLNGRNRFSRQKTAIRISVLMNNSMYHNGHRVIDEFHRLKILRAPQAPYSPDISLCDFWMFGDFKGKQKDRHLQDPEEILTVFQELRDKINFKELRMVFESWRDRLR